MTALHVIIDGRAYDLPGDYSLLDGLRTAGIELPALCHDDRLASTGACRLCEVRVAGEPRLVAACATPLRDGMEIDTAAPDIRETRRALLEMLARHYPADAVQRFPDKMFHRALVEHGLTGAAAPAASGTFEDSSHPYLRIDMTRCIDCYRCVRICEDLQGQLVWHVRGRGLDTRVQPDAPTLGAGACVSCGACADTCPTGAIEDQTVFALGSPSRRTRTVCPYCGV